MPTVYYKTGGQRQFPLTASVALTSMQARMKISLIQQSPQKCASIRRAYAAFLLKPHGFIREPAE